MKRESEIPLHLRHNKNPYSQSTVNRFRCGSIIKYFTKKEADSQTKALFTVWQTLSFQSRDDWLWRITASSCSANLMRKSHWVFFAVCLCSSSQLFCLHNKCRPQHDVIHPTSYGNVSAMQSKWPKDRVVYNYVSMRPLSLYQDQRYDTNNSVVFVWPLFLFLFTSINPIDRNIEIIGSL